MMKAFYVKDLSPAFSIRLQAAAFKHGFEWPASGQEIKYEDKPVLLFAPWGNIYWAEDDVQIRQFAENVYTIAEVEARLVSFDLQKKEKKPVLNDPLVDLVRIILDELPEMVTAYIVKPEPAKEMKAEMPMAKLVTSQVAQ